MAGDEAGNLDLDRLGKQRALPILKAKAAANAKYACLDAPVLDGKPQPAAECAAAKPN